MVYLKQPAKVKLRKPIGSWHYSGIPIRTQIISNKPNRSLSKLDKLILCYRTQRKNKCMIDTEESMDELMTTLIFRDDFHFQMHKIFSSSSLEEKTLSNNL